MVAGRVRDPAELSGPSVRHVRVSYVEEQYPTLVRNSRLRASDLRRLRDEMATFGYKPLITLLMPVSNVEWLERSLDSVVDQVYPNWELCVCCDEDIEERIRGTLSRYQRLDERIKVGHPGTGAAVLWNGTLSLATGEFAGVLGDGDELAPDALFEVVKLLQEHTDSDLIYSDEDEVDEVGSRARPRFKPDWAPDLLLSSDYISRLGVYRMSLLKEVGGFREGFDDCQDYDLALRATERTDRIQHVSKVLYHRRSSTGSPASPEDGPGVERTRRALSEALERRGLEGSVEDGLLSGSFRVRPEIKGEPKVSLIIPTRDNVSLLKNCLERVERLTTYRNYEILIMDNDSVDPATVEYLASTPHRVIPFREPFNYSSINNAGVSHAEGEYVLLLNDDTEVISGEWLEAMLEHAQRPDVGAVGAKLIYPDGRIQHAGVLTGVGGSLGLGVATHSHQFYASASPGYLGTIAKITNYSAVTAACMLLRKSVFDEVGGFDEENLSVSFNDVDLCLRIRERGYSIVYTPHAELYHHESVSRGYRGNAAEIVYMRERWGEVLDEDPYYNHNFSKGSGDFNLRADFLRPRVLRTGIGQAQEDSETAFKNAMLAQGEELKRYIAVRQRTVRNSYRNALVPARGNKGIKLPPPEDSDPREDKQPRSAPTRRADTRESPRTEQLIWMFGSPRTGSTWLSRMMAELDGQKRWHEPYVGLLFGSFIHERLEGNSKLLNNPSFIMGEPYREVWLNSIRNFVIEGAVARYPNLEKDDYLIIKEPNGSIGAPLLLEATPESRLIFLIRDPRDVVASRLDAFEKGSWSAQDRNYDTLEKLYAFTKHLAEDFFTVVSQVQKSYEAHPGNKALVRYEDLREDAVGTLETMYAALEIGFDKAQLEAAVAKHSWEQIPDSDKGSGKFYRKAQPGSWREDLSPKQIRLIEDITGPILSRYYQPADQTFFG